MKVELAILQLRFKQVFRLLQSAGWGTVLIAAPIGLILVLTILDKLQTAIDPYFLGLYVFLVLSVHNRRQDHRLLKQLHLSRFQLFAMEYTLLGLPLSVTFGLLGHWKLAATGQLAIVLLCLGFSFFNFRMATQGKNWSLSFLPDLLWEWKASIRRYHYKLITLWILGAVAALNEFAYFLFLFLFVSIISATFKPSEGKELRPVSSGELTTKLVKNAVILLAFLLPHFAITVCFNPAYWFLSLGILGYLLLYQTYCLLFKYAAYSQDRDVPNEIPTAIFMVLCPVLVVSVPMIVFSFIRAKKRLKYA